MSPEDAQPISNPAGLVREISNPIKGKSINPLRVSAQNQPDMDLFLPLSENVQEFFSARRKQTRLLPKLRVRTALVLREANYL
jgi:hypothetical protein